MVAARFREPGSVVKYTVVKIRYFYWITEKDMNFRDEKLKWFNISVVKMLFNVSLVTDKEMDTKCE